MGFVTDWIYNNPTWLWGGILIALLVGTACIALSIFHRFVHLDVRKAHNDLAGFLVAVISVVYAVLLAFIAIATWESYTQAEDLVQNEADYVDSIYRDTVGLPPNVARQIRDDLQAYVNTVVNVEWPIQATGVSSQAGPKCCASCMRRWQRCSRRISGNP